MSWKLEQPNDKNKKKEINYSRAEILNNYYY